MYQGWASLELREENLVTAKRLISEALTKDKRQGSGWLVAAQIEERQGNSGLVGLVLRRGIECAPNEAALYCALGDHLVGKGKYQDVSGLNQAAVGTIGSRFFAHDSFFQYRRLDKYSRKDLK